MEFNFIRLHFLFLHSISFFFDYEFPGDRWVRGGGVIKGDKGEERKGL